MKQTIRPYMLLGWFMAYALGAMHIRDNGYVVVKTWCADTDPEELVTYTKIDNERGIMHVSSTPW